MHNCWQQHQTWDGTYSLDDLLDWHEMFAVMNENKKRAQLAAQAREGR